MTMHVLSRNTGKRGRPARFYTRLGKGIVTATILFFGVLMMTPFLFMFSTSMRHSAEAYKLPPSLIPESFFLGNYVELLQSSIPFGQMFINSMVVAVAVILGQLIVCSMGAYAFAKLDFPGKSPLFLCFLLSMMIPAQATIIPIYIMISKLRLVNTLPALILPALFNSFGTFLLRQFFMTMPKAIDEAAKIDGAGYWTTFWRIVLPQAVTPLASLTILTFNNVWNDYFNPLIFINSWEKMTIPLGIAALKGYMGAGNRAVIMAGVSLAVVPVLLIFLFCQKFIVEGLTSGSVKG